MKRDNFTSLKKNTKDYFVLYFVFAQKMEFAAKILSEAYIE